MTKLDYISLGLIFFAVIVITLGIVKIHCYPGKVAQDRNHPQAKAIEVTSLLGLLVFPLWMFALVWAYSNAIIGKVYRAEEPEVESAPKPLPEFLEKHRKHRREARKAAEAESAAEAETDSAADSDASADKNPGQSKDQ
jgi:hypothetical protein